MAIAPPTSSTPDTGSATRRRYRRTLGFLWWVPLIIAVIAGIAAFTVTASAEDVYVADALVLAPENPDPPADAYAALATERTVLREVIRTLRIPTTEEGLASAIETHISSRRLIEVKARATTAQGAQLLLQTLVTQMTFQAPELLGAEPPEVLRSARTPGDAEDHGEARNTALAVAGGLIAGIGIAAVLGRRELYLRTPRELERVTGRSTLGVVPSPGRDAGVALLRRPQSAEADAYRDLALAVRTLDPPPRRIVVAGPRAGQGASALAANLAVALTETGLRVALIDADLREPTAHRLLDLPNDRGLSDVLWGRPAEGLPADAVHEVALAGDLSPLIVITSGFLPRDPSSILTSTAIAGLLRSLEEAEDGPSAIVVDAPPIEEHAEVAALAEQTDLVLLAVASESILSGPLAAAAETLEAAAPMVALVLTRARRDALEEFAQRHAPAEPTAGGGAGNEDTAWSRGDADDPYAGRAAPPHPADTYADDDGGWEDDGWDEDDGPESDDTFRGPPSGLDAGDEAEGVTGWTLVDAPPRPRPAPGPEASARPDAPWWQRAREILDDTGPAEERPDDGLPPPR